MVLMHAEPAQFVIFKKIKYGMGFMRLHWFGEFGGGAQYRCRREGTLGEPGFRGLVDYAIVLCLQFLRGLVGCHGSGDNIC